MILGQMASPTGAGHFTRLEYLFNRQVRAINVLTCGGGGRPRPLLRLERTRSRSSISNGRFIRCRVGSKWVTLFHFSRTSVGSLLLTASGFKLSSLSLPDSSLTLLSSASLL